MEEGNQKLELSTLKFTPKLGEKVARKLENLGFEGIEYAEQGLVSKKKFNTAGQLIAILQANKEEFQEKFQENFNKNPFLKGRVQLDFSDYNNHIDSIVKLLKVLEIPEDDIKLLQTKSAERVGDFIERFQEDKFCPQDRRLIKQYPDFFDSLDGQLKEAKITIQVYQNILAHILSYFPQEIDAKILGVLKEIIQNGYIGIISEMIDFVKFPDLISMADKVDTDKLIQILQEIDTDKLIQILQEIDTDKLIRIMNKVDTSNLISIMKQVDTVKLYSIMREVDTNNLIRIMREVDTVKLISIMKQIDTVNLTRIMKQVNTVNLTRIMKQIDTDKLTRIMKKADTDKLIRVMNKIDTDDLIKMMAETDSLFLSIIINDSSMDEIVMVFTPLVGILEKYGPDKLDSILKGSFNFGEMYEKYKNNGKLLEYRRFIEKEGRIPRK